MAFPPRIVFASSSSEGDADPNFQHFLSKHLGTWEGRWIALDGTGALSDSFDVARSMRRESETEFVKTDRRRYGDGREEAPEWRFDSGVFQPLGALGPGGRKAYFLPGGSEVSTTSAPFRGADLFLVDGPFRASVACFYGEDGAIGQLTVVREGPPGTPREQLEERAGVQESSPFRWPAASSLSGCEDAALSESDLRFGRPDPSSLPAWEGSDSPLLHARISLPGGGSLFLPLRAPADDCTPFAATLVLRGRVDPSSAKILESRYGPGGAFRRLVFASCAAEGVAGYL
eukprot:tig00020675_g12681.t1